MEEEAKEGGGDAGVLGVEMGHGGPDDLLGLGAFLAVEIVLQWSRRRRGGIGGSLVVVFLESKKLGKAPNGGGIGGGGVVRLLLGATAAWADEAESHQEDGERDRRPPHRRGYEYFSRLLDLSPGLRAGIEGR